MSPEMLKSPVKPSPVILAVGWAHDSVPDSPMLYECLLALTIGLLLIIPKS